MGLAHWLPLGLNILRQKLKLAAEFELAGRGKYAAPGAQHRKRQKDSKKRRTSVTIPEIQVGVRPHVI